MTLPPYNKQIKCSPIFTFCLTKDQATRPSWCVLAAVFHGQEVCQVSVAVVDGQCAVTSVPKSLNTR